MKEDKSQASGVILALTAGTSWGIISLFIRSLSKLGMSSTDIASTRNICGCLILCAAALLKPSTFKVRMRDLWCMFGTGVCSIFLFNVFYFQTMQRSTVNLAVVLLYTSPAFVSIMSRIFFKERFGRGRVLSLALVLGGCVLVSGVLSSGQTASPSVILSGLFSGFLYALYSIFGRFALNRGYSGETITVWTFIFSALASVFSINYSTLATCASQSPRTFALSTLELVVISTILPYYTYTLSLRKLNPSKAAIIVAVEPVVGTLIGMLVFGETLTLTSLAGMTMILGAMFL